MHVDKTVPVIHGCSDTKNMHKRKSDLISKNRKSPAKTGLFLHIEPIKNRLHVLYAYNFFIAASLCSN